MTDTQTAIPPLQKWKIELDITRIDSYLRDAHGTYGHQIFNQDEEDYVDELLDKRLELMRMR